MSRISLFLAAAYVLLLASCTQGADEADDPTQYRWTLNPEGSYISFGSEKSGQIGEVHEFTVFSGHLAPDQWGVVEINLKSLQTHIEQRNERMRDHLFGGEATSTARITLPVDKTIFKSFAIGERKLIEEAELTLEFNGDEFPLSADLAATRLANDKVLVETVSLIYLDTKELGLETGVEKLRELANLPSISFAVPVSASLIFVKDG